MQASSDTLQDFFKEVDKLKSTKTAEHSTRFFRSGPGQYAKGDKFLGIRVPLQRNLAKNFANKFSLTEIISLLKNEYHEIRLTALFMLIHHYKKADSTKKKAIVETYLQHADFINNWDLVDSSAHQILGDYLFRFDLDTEILFKLAREDHLWKNRIAIIATYKFIKENSFEPTLTIAKILLNHPHDLIHKAVGWMLREIGKRNIKTEDNFLNKYYQEMPRTMLRYAIEKLPATKRQKYLKGLI